jgi:hypothetical protein
MKIRKTTQWRGKVKHENIHFVVRLPCAMVFYATYILKNILKYG